MYQSQIRRDNHFKSDTKYDLKVKRAFVSWRTIN